MRLTASNEYASAIQTVSMPAALELGDGVGGLDDVARVVDLRSKSAWTHATPELDRPVK